MNDKKNFTIVECAGGIVRNQDCIALIKMKRIDGWGFPKGKIEPGETFLAAAEREIFEETGIKDASFVKSLSTYQRQVADGKPMLLNIYMFLFTTDQEEINSITNDVLGAQWFPIKEISSYLTLAADKHFFETVIKEM